MPRKVTVVRVQSFIVPEAQKTGCLLPIAMLLAGLGALASVLAWVV